MRQSSIFSYRGIPVLKFVSHGVVVEYAGTSEVEYMDTEAVTDCLGYVGDL